jgi:hypothetical protein
LVFSYLGVFNNTPTPKPNDSYPNTRIPKHPDNPTC